MEANDKIPLISASLHEWYAQNKRDLPWRHSQDPYHIWLSEVILQQTRVEQGLPYYHSFVAAFPTVEDLAMAPEDEVMKLWQGLGYYSRARNLHRAAKIVTNEFGGRFPNTKDGLLTLPGVGPYTAAAIASIAFEEAAPVVDGNVIRVISRLFGISAPVDSPATLREIHALAKSLLAEHKPSVHNQAMMEFGALQCTPKPDCSACPIQTYCNAMATSRVHILPVKAKKLKRKQRHFHYLVANHEDQILLEKRGSGDIWQGLYQFPMIERSEAPDLAMMEQHLETTIRGMGRRHVSPKHVLTHQDIHATFYELQVDLHKKSKFELHDKRELHRFAVPKLIERFLKKWMP